MKQTANRIVPNRKDVIGAQPGGKDVNKNYRLFRQAAHDVRAASPRLPRHQVFTILRTTGMLCNQ